MRVLIIPDKFKGTLTAYQAAAAIARGWRRARPSDSLELLPMSDGGEGFGGAMSRLLGAKVRYTMTVDAAHRPVRARWWWAADTRTAIIESAEVIGLAMLPARQFHPFDLDTFGLGKVLMAAARMQPRRCLIGIGGSATNDGGFGIARALGWKFLARQQTEITEWPTLFECRRIIPARLKLTLGRLTVALDVQNPLLGIRGCTRVYGPQKGLRSQEFSKAEAALRRISGLMALERGVSMAKVSGAGAAGGLGFGLMAFLKAQPVEGFSLFAQAAGLKQRVREADLIITGEGCLDAQSMMGKGVGALAKLSRQSGVPFIAIAGSAPEPAAGEGGLASIYVLDHLTTRSQALNEPARWVSQAAKVAAQDRSSTL